MNKFQKKAKSEDLIIIKTTSSVQRSTIFYQQDYQDSRDQPELVMYQMLRSIIRRQMCKPLQLLKQFLLFPEDDQSSIEANYKHMKYELEIVAENIRNVCTLYKQRLLIEGFITIKNAYFKRLRVEEAYYNIQNLTRLNISLNFLRNMQRLYLKWAGFGSLYENYKGLKLSKINLSRIDIVNNQNTQNYLEDLNPFIIERGREIEAVNSYIMDHSIQEDNYLSAEIINEEIDDHSSSKNEGKVIKQYQSIEEHLRSAEKKNRKTASNIREKKDNDELEGKILITHRKELLIKEAGSTNRQTKNQKSGQQLFLIRDYKPKAQPPTNYIKVPIVGDNVKIVELQNGRKKSSRKKRISREQLQIEREICQNCKYCLQMKQHRQTIKVIQQRFQYIQINKETSTQINRSSTSTSIPAR